MTDGSKLEQENDKETNLESNDGSGAFFSVIWPFLRYSLSKTRDVLELLIRELPLSRRVATLLIAGITVPIRLFRGTRWT